MNNIRKFEDILDECLERLLVKGEALEQCLQSFPQQSDELKPLLETVLASRQVSAIQPGSEFRNRARYQFQAALQEIGQKKSRSFFSWGWQPRWATALATVLAIFLAGGGAVAAASGSMPDSPLYAVKRASEQAQLAITFSRVGKAELHTKLADKRVMEIVYLADKDRPGKMAQATDRLNTHLTEIAALISGQRVVTSLIMAPEIRVQEETVAVEERGIPSAAPVPAPTVIDVEEEGAVEKPAVAEKAPVTIAVPAPPEAVDVRGKERAVEEMLLPSQAAERGQEAGPKDDRQAKLQTKVGRQASNNIARLYALLETAPESARPALLRAIAVSEAGYQKALESLEQR